MTIPHKEALRTIKVLEAALANARQYTKALEYNQERELAKLNSRVSHLQEQLENCNKTRKL